MICPCRYANVSTTIMNGVGKLILRALQEGGWKQEAEVGEGRKTGSGIGMNQLSNMLHPHVQHDHLCMPCQRGQTLLTKPLGAWWLHIRLCRT
jgi:hypothetical protein